MSGFVRPFGTLQDGREVVSARLEADSIAVEILNYGGIIRGIEVPDSLGRRANVVLGLTTIEDYEQRNPYFGAIIGRCANRIENGRFQLDGNAYAVTVNDAPSSVHGGTHGFDRKLWLVEHADESTLELSYTSPDGDEGFPGELQTTVRYEVTGPATLRITYSAVTDAPTVVNLTNHSFFNLAGEGTGSVLDHIVTINAEKYLPVREDLIPVGSPQPVGGTAMDFRTPRAISDRIRAGDPQLTISRGYDHNFILERRSRNGDGLAFAARVVDPASQRSLEIWTSEPAIDFYTGNFLDGSLVGPSGRAYRQSDGLAIEPERVSNAVNGPECESVILRPGGSYRHVTEYRFGTE